MTTLRLNIGWEAPDGTLTVMALFALFCAWLSLLALACWWLSLFELTVGLMVFTLSFVSVLALLAIALFEAALPPPVPPPDDEDEDEGGCMLWVL